MKKVYPYKIKKNIITEYTVASALYQIKGLRPYLTVVCAVVSEFDIANCVCHNDGIMTVTTSEGTCSCFVIDTGNLALRQNRQNIS